MTTDFYLLADEIAGIHKIDDDSDYTAKAKKLVKLDAVDHGISHAVAGIRPSALGGVGRTAPVQHGTMEISRTFDPSSIQILTAHLKGDVLKLVHLFGARVLKSDGDRYPQPVLHIVMSNVIIANYHYTMFEDGTSETIVLKYSSIGWRFRAIQRGKSDDTPSNKWAECWWDGKKNTNTKDDAFTTTVLDANKHFESAGYKAKPGGLPGL